jgi:uncharacterized membrane protein YhaH (DUF805 family)
MNIGQAITSCMGKYATFSGRATRSEFWWFYLFLILMSWGGTVVGSAVYGPENLTANAPAIIVNLVFAVPFFSAGARRLHDIGKSGWWQLILLTGIGFILLIIWWAVDTKSENDRYGKVTV